ncbi:oxidant-induced cell-cycle arrest protein 5 [Monosporozyma servazzii]
MSRKQSHISSNTTTNNNSNSNISNSHHLKNLKQQYNDRKLIHLIINLIKCNDHDTLAFIARTYGIPPQLRHIVWPILLKYHPMCISPNIISNIVGWDSQTESYQFLQPSNKREHVSSTTAAATTTTTTTTPTTIDTNSPISSTNKTTTNNEDLEYLIIHDLKKYFHTRTNKSNKAKTNHTTKDSVSNPTTPISETKTFPNLPTTQTTSTNNNNNNNNIHEDFSEKEIIILLKNAILAFLNKWSSIFKYENGLSWVALGLAEWFPIMGSIQEPVVLTGRRHSKDQKDTSSHNDRANNTTATTTATANTSTTNNHDNTTTKDEYLSNKKQNDESINNLYNEYPLPKRLRDKLPQEYQFQFNELYERLLLIILHCPDTVMAKDQINKEFPVQSSNLSNYFPILSGGDLTFQSQIFFKIFASILPELYQPLMEETDFPQTNSSKSTWLYWWIKFSGAKVLQRQDRGRLWDILLGWRPKPNMNSINFYLNYNNKIFHQFYKKNPVGINKLNELSLVGKVTSHSIKRLNAIGLRDSSSQNHNIASKLDPFWFPDLNCVPFGGSEYPYDYNIFRELLIRNKYDSTPAKTGNNTPTPSSLSSGNSSSVSLSDASGSSEDEIDEKDNSNEDKTGTDEDDENSLIYSLIDPHIEILFIYMAILQYNEFKLLEFEETEISEFLNNLPMCSRIDDLSYQRLYLMEELNSTSTINTPTKKSMKSYSVSASSSNTILHNDLQQDKNGNKDKRPHHKSHMFIEVGNDAKASHSFNDLLTIAGDIWRKWLWKELEENLNSDE